MKNGKNKSLEADFPRTFKFFRDCSGLFTSTTFCHSSCRFTAIDELDSGIYEYLLGELLQIMERSGLGQLIFTSHNLRPLEMLNSSSIIFTTTNPENRYVRASNIKPGNNLRQHYFRDITLGSNGEELYQETNSIEIAHAMRKAGIPRWNAAEEV